MVMEFKSPRISNALGRYKYPARFVAGVGSLVAAAYASNYAETQLASVALGFLLYSATDEYIIKPLTTHHPKQPI